MFPSDKVILQLWIDAVGRENGWKSKNRHICSLHFTPDCFVSNDYMYQKLKLNVVPTLNMKHETIIMGPPISKNIDDEPMDIDEGPSTSTAFIACNRCVEYEGIIESLKKKIGHVQKISRRHLLKLHSLYDYVSGEYLRKLVI